MQARLNTGMPRRFIASAAMGNKWIFSTILGGSVTGGGGFRIGKVKGDAPANAERSHQQTIESNKDFL